MHDLRTLLLRALLLDWLGQASILAMMLWMPTWTGIVIGGESLQGQELWLVFSFLLYPLLGWLFGSYTLLRSRRLTFAGAVEAPCYHCNLHSNGGGHCPLADQSQ